MWGPDFSGGVAFLWWNQQPAGSVVVERMSTISMSMSVLDDNPSSSTAANDSVSSSLTQVDELLEQQQVNKSVNGKA